MPPVRFLLLALLALTACGGHPSPGDAGLPATGGGAGGGGGGEAPDAGPDAAVADGGEDAGEPDAGWPEADHPVFPTAENLGGALLKHPRVVAVTFPNDPLAADIDTFTAAFATTSYWQHEVAEYGIDKPVPLPGVRDGFSPPSSIDDTEIQALVKARLEDGDAGWPAPDGDTLYALYFPPGTTVTQQGYQSCATFHGYHFDTTLTDGTRVPYAVISRCDSLPELPGVTGIDYAAAVASHEVIEALTDPMPYDAPAFAQTDMDHIAWTLAVGGELGDLCALEGDAFYQPADFPYGVQRIWSNAAAAAGHDPCTPQPSGEPYFNSVPVLDDAITFAVQGQQYPTQGVHIAVGQSKDVELDLFSDGPTSAPWSVDAFEYSASPSHLQLSVDKPTGQNGDHRHLTIQVLKQDPTWGAELFVVVSRLGSRTHLYFGLVGN